MRFEAAVSEDRRQAVHVLMGAFALLLPYIPWWQAVAMAVTAVLFNLFALQRVLGLAVFRPGERLGRLTSGIVLYPIAILALLLIFPSRPDIVGGAWGVLAAGDGMATIVGRRVPIAPPLGHSPCHFQTIDLRHLNVQQDDVVMLPLHRIEGLNAVGCHVRTTAGKST